MSVVLIPDTLSAQAVRPPGPDQRRFELSGPTMGTQWRVEGYGPPGLGDQDIRALITAPLNKLVGQMSHWDAATPLSQFAKAPAQTWVPLPHDVRVVLKAALALAEKSEGAFSPCLAPLCDQWGFGPSGRRTSPPDMTQTKPSPDWRDLHIDALSGTVLQPGGVGLDLSAIAKGFAVDRVGDALLSAGIDSWIIDIGGEVRASGVKRDGRPWWVDMPPPPGSGLQTDRLALVGMGVATSSPLQNAFHHQGRSYGHLLDPHTQRPLSSNTLQVTVCHDSVMWADGWATALSAMPWRAGLALANREGLKARFWIETDQSVQVLDSELLMAWGH